MGSKWIAHETKDRMGYWLRGHEGKIQLVGQNYWDKTTLASKTQFNRHCFGFQSWHFFATTGL